MGTGFPGYTGIIPKSTALVSQVLRDNGYATSMFGKWHNTPEPDISPAGPFDRWPTGLGFDYFYGFNQGETHQYYPTLYRNTVPVPQPKSPEAGLSLHRGHDRRGDRLDSQRPRRRSAQAVVQLLQHRRCPCAAPRPRRSGGTNSRASSTTVGTSEREIIHERQLAMGVIPQGTKLTPRPKEIPAWDSLSADQKKVYLATHGELCRLHGPHRSSRRPLDR